MNDWISESNTDDDWLQYLNNLLLFHLENSVKCRICLDTDWVCEMHPKIAWNEGKGCCGGAGMHCECVRAKAE